MTMMDPESPSSSPSFFEYNDNVVDDDYLTHVVENYNPVVLTILPKIPAFISIVSSAIFIHEVLVDINSSPRRRRGDQRVIPNMLLALSISDVILSLSWFLGASVAPKEQPGLWGNFGNTGSCVFGGFLMQFGMVASPLCNLGLSFYFLLIVNFNWRDAKRIEIVENWLHVCIWSITIALTIIPIIYDMYNFDGVACWVAPYPLKCNHTSDYPKSEAVCIRGKDAWAVAEATATLIMISILGCSIIMGFIYVNVRKLEERISRYSGSIRSINQSQGRLIDGSASLAMEIASSRQFVSPNRVRFNGIEEEDEQQQHQDDDDKDNNNDTNDNDQSQRASVTFEELTADNASRHITETNETKENNIEETIITTTTTTQGQSNNNDNKQKKDTTTTSTRPKPLNFRPQDLEVEAQRQINREKSKRVAIQGMWYIIAFLLTYALGILSLCLLVSDIVFVPLDYAAHFMLPLQGFFSFYVFCRTRTEMKTRGGKILKRIIYCRGCSKIPDIVADIIRRCCKKSDAVEIIHA